MGKVYGTLRQILGSASLHRVTLTLVVIALHTSGGCN